MLTTRRVRVAAESVSARKPHGFTVLELLVVVTVTAVTCAIAIPALHRLLVQNRLSVSSNQILMAALAARQTAITHNRSISFCAGRPDVGCHGNWTLREWIIFDDADLDGVLDAGEQVRVADRLTDTAALTIAGNGPFLTAIVFKPSGAAQTSTGAFAAGRLRLCSNQAAPGNGIDLVLIGSGRIESERKDFVGDCPPP